MDIDRIETAPAFESSFANGGRSISQLETGEAAPGKSKGGILVGQTDKGEGTAGARKAGVRVSLDEGVPCSVYPPTSDGEGKPLKHHRAPHPAEKRAAQRQQQDDYLLAHDFGPMDKETSPVGTTFARGPHAKQMGNAFRRMSRVATIRKAGIQMRNMQYGAIFSRFSRHSTIHGVCHAALAPTPWWKHFWYIVFSVCLSVLIIQVIWLTLKYLNYPKTVDLDLKFENAPFPAITLCNLNPYKASMVGSDKSIQATMEAFRNILSTTGRNEGIAAAIASSVRSRRQLRREKSEAQRNRPTANNSRNITPQQLTQRRYLQVYAQCYCEISRLTAERKRGSCFPAYKGKISFSVDQLSPLYNFHPTKCLCQLDWEHVCTECSEKLGHCPMRFYKDTKRLGDDADVCLCHRDYNHCIATNENGEIPEIIPSFDPEQLNFIESFVAMRQKGPPGSGGLYEDMLLPRVTTTPQPPEVVQAMGFEELKDEIAINAQARENLRFTVEEKPLTERVELSQPKNELILKCSFNQRDCDIDKDFNLHYDPTYGNCYTFNWKREEAVTAHRVGANYGLRVILFANVSEYLPTTEAVGFRVTVHDKKRFERIEEPHGQCRHGGENAATYIYKGYGYSIEGCHRSCTQNEVVRICGCADPMFPPPDGVKPCRVSDPSARECIKNTTQYLGELIARKAILNCECYQPCRETGYEVSYSAAKWPSGTTKMMECEARDDLCIEKYRQNAAMIEVFYEELNYETLTENAAYTIPSLMADLGGVIGLWIGISFVSILELIQLFYFCCDAYRKRRKISSSPSHMHSLHGRFHRSLTNSSNQLYQPMSVASSVKKASSQIDEPPLRLVVDDAGSVSSSSSSPPRKHSHPYLSPNDELPCTCLYGSSGNLVFMKPLCPFHGYLVRRNTAVSGLGLRRDTVEELVKAEEESPTKDPDEMNEEEVRLLLDELAMEAARELDPESRKSTSLSIGSKVSVRS